MSGKPHLRLALLVAMAWPCVAIAEETPLRDPIVQALVDELQRVPRLVVPGAQAPYHVALRVADHRVIEVEASFGALVSSFGFPDRQLFADVRVGSYEYDNGNFEPDRAWSDFADRSRRWLPFEDDNTAIRRDAWLAIDAGYKAALRALGQKTATLTRQHANPDRVAGFSREPPVQMFDLGALSPLDRSLEKLVEKLSATGRRYPHFSSSEARIEGFTGRRIFVSTEGSRVIEPRAQLEMSVVFRAQADDGMSLAHFLVLGACQASRLPSDDALETQVLQIAGELEGTRQASLAEDYTGPVLFEGIAAAQLVAQLLQTALSGTPPVQGIEPGGAPDSTLGSQVGQRIFPPGFNLIDDPTLDQLGHAPLAGCYRVDDEGVVAQKVNLVEDGIFKAFVMSRTPRKGFERSNGHGRDSFGGVRGRIANLILSSKAGVAGTELRRRLIKAARAAHKPYALIVRTLDDPSFTHEQNDGWFSGNRHGEQRVLVLNKLTLDGKEQPLRGASLQSIDLRALKDILAAGTVPSVFSSYGDSVASPPLLFEDVTIRRSSGPTQKPPLMPRPDLAPNPVNAQ